MKIRAVANGNVIHADDDAAKILIDAGIYTAADDEPATATLTPPVPPSSNSTQPPVEKKPTRKRKAR